MAYPIIKELQERMGDNMRFVFRDFPLTNVHPNAELSAEAAQAVGAQGKFWEMHDTLYENQDAVDYEDLMNYAEPLELDLQRFADELADHVYFDRIREDFISGVRSGVNGTPSFFINGIRHDGAWDLDTLLRAVHTHVRGAAA
jgi:protein-disulfide isomerase